MDNLNDEQQNALGTLAGDRNVFLTGAAGSGKSYVLRQWLAGRSDIPILASTGAAAILIGGRTFHGFFGLGIMEGGPRLTVEKALNSGFLIRRVCKAHTIVIDEISMISGPVLACAEEIARRARYNLNVAEGLDPEVPWGGLRIIAVGDFSQLPPVNKFSKEREWAFKHQVWADSNFIPVVLKKVMRTDEPEFLTVLNKIRTGNLDIPTMQWLDALKVKRKTANILRLFSHRADTEKYNLDMLVQLPHPLQTVETKYSTPEQMPGQPVCEDTVRKHGKDFPISARFQFKLDALVMFRSNDDKGRWVNGSLGAITNHSEDFSWIMVKVERTGETVTVRKQTFTYFDKDGDPVLTARNFPLTLAWASTIHKSQGMTVDRMLTDISKLWEPGQAYVALSRCRSAEGLFIENWNARSIFADREVLNFYKNLEELQ